jgi:phage major head subunit gpT-like protein
MREQFVRLLDNRLKKVAEGELKELDPMIPTLYSVQGSDSAWEEFFEVGSLPDIPEFTGKLEYLGIEPGYHCKIEPKEYAGGVQMERKLIKDKKYAVMDNRAKLLAQSANRTKEKLGVRPFAYAFSTAFDFMTSEEGVALCSTAHTTKASVSTTYGFSNAGTSALSKTSIAATRLLMRKFRNDIAERIQISPDTLLVPDNLYDTAMEIMGTDKGLYSAEGTVNMQKGRFNVIPYMRLDDYDTNNWYMIDKGLMKQHLLWINREGDEVNNTIDFETFMIKTSIYFRVGNGFTNWRWIYGHNVS